MNPSKLNSLSYQHKVGISPLLSTTVGQLLENIGKKHPNQMAVVSAYQSKSITFSDLLKKADIFAAGLMNVGISKGDHVAVWSPNSIEWVIVSLACARGGFILVQLNHSYKANELLYSVNHVRVKVLICGCSTDKQDYYSILKTVDEGMFERAELWPKVKSKKMKSLQLVVTMSKNEGTLCYQDVFKQATEESIELLKKNQSRISMDDPLNIQFTSGTTGNPKAAILSHHNVVNNAYFVGRRFGMHEKQHSICVNVPFFHTYGTTTAIICALNFAATLVLPYDFYNPQKSLQAIAKHKCTIIYGTPTMYVDLIAQQKTLHLDIKPEIICIGGAPSIPQLITDIYNHMNVDKVVNVYGMTEGTAIFYQSYLDSDEEQIRKGHGCLGDHIEAKVIDENGNIVPIGSPGELCIRGYNTILGYYHRDNSITTKTLMNNGWLHTGDMFIMFDDGSGQVIGRIKDIIIRGGENIYPTEIENYIATHPSILECHVVGLPHARLGEEICACVRIKDKSVIDLEAVQRFCKQGMAHYKIPSRLYVLQHFSKTASGKVQKFKLVELICNLK